MLAHPPRRFRTRWTRPAIALVAMVLQLVLVAAPVAEFRDAQAIAAAGASVRAPVGEQVVAPAHHGPLAHDEARCPACLARSLHARLEFPSPLPVFQAERGAVLELAHDHVAQPDHPSSHLSRAPPIAG